MATMYVKVEHHPAPSVAVGPLDLKAAVQLQQRINAKAGKMVACSMVDAVVNVCYPSIKRMTVQEYAAWLKEKIGECDNYLKLLSI